VASSLVSILSCAASIELAGSSLCSRTLDLGSVTDSNRRPRSAARNQAVRAVPARTAPRVVSGWPSGGVSDPRGTPRPADR
jgi:hypothetical protein